MRVAGLVGYVVYLVWLMMFEDLDLEDYGWARWVSGAVLVTMLGCLIRHMMHTW